MPTMRRDLKRNRPDFNKILPFPQRIVQRKSSTVKLFMQLVDTVYNNVYMFFFKRHELEMLGLRRKRECDAPLFFVYDYWNLHKKLNHKEMLLLPKANFSGCRSLSFVNSNVTIQIFCSLSKGDLSSLKALKIYHNLSEPLPKKDEVVDWLMWPHQRPLASINMPSLEILVFTNSIIGFGLSKIEECKWTSLKEIHFNHNRLGNGCIAIIARCDFQLLEKLDLSSNRITNDGIKTLKKGQWKELKGLYLRDNLITEKWSQLLWPSCFPAIEVMLTDMCTEEKDPQGKASFSTAQPYLYLSKFNLQSGHKMKFKCLKNGHKGQGYSRLEKTLTYNRIQFDLSARNQQAISSDYF